MLFIPCVNQCKYKNRFISKTILGYSMTFWYTSGTPRLVIDWAAQKENCDLDLFLNVVQFKNCIITVAKTFLASFRGKKGNTIPLIRPMMCHMTSCMYLKKKKEETT